MADVKTALEGVHVVLHLSLSHFLYISCCQTRHLHHFPCSHCSYHVLHVGGGWIDATSEFVVQKKDLLTIGPWYCAAYTRAWQRGRDVGLQLVLVATQQPPELRWVRQEVAEGQTSGREKQHEGQQSEHGGRKDEGSAGDGDGAGCRWQMMEITKLEMKTDLEKKCRNSVKSRTISRKKKFNTINTVKHKLTEPPLISVQKN